MSRNYGSLGRRSSSAAWQWVVIGLILGFACSATLFLGSLAAGIVSIDGQGAAFGVTITPIVITATPEPATPTEMPTEVLVTPTSEVIIEAPSPTPTIDPTELTPMATATPEETEPPAVSQLGAAGGPGAEQTDTLGGGSIRTSSASLDDGPPDILLRIASELVPIDGGEFQMGTTPAEAAIAVRDCVERDGGNCLSQWADDSFPQHPVTVSPFLMEVTEVSYEQYVAFLNWMGPGSHANGCDGQPCLATRSESETSSVTFDSANYSVASVIADLPVGEVTWYGAKSYC